jgi:hypothetical protein
MGHDPKKQIRDKGFPQYLTDTFLIILTIDSLVSLPKKKKKKKKVFSVPCCTLR